MRKPIIAGNWKMNNTAEAGVNLAKALIERIDTDKVDVAICVPFTAISEISKVVKGTKICLGAQNIHFAPSGAYTGEISAEMLKEFGVSYVVVGHSERRQYFGETDAVVSKRSKAAIENGIVPIICVGETLEEREGNITESVIKTQIEGAFAEIKDYADLAEKVVIAYEPVWAIGTGKTATKEQANETIGFIRNTLKAIIGDEADKMRLQYGGSMNTKNADELMAMEEIDGGLIGGASLKADDFTAIVTAGVNSVK